MDYGVRQSQEAFPEVARKDKDDSSGREGSIRKEPEQSRSSRLESHCKGCKSGQGPSSWTGPGVPQERDRMAHTSPAAERRGGPGETRSWRPIPSVSQDGLGWPSGGGGSTGAGGLSTGLVRSRWKEAEREAFTAARGPMWTEGRRPGHPCSCVFAELRLQSPCSSSCLSQEGPGCAPHPEPHRH